MALYSLITYAAQMTSPKVALDVADEQNDPRSDVGMTAFHDWLSTLPEDKDRTTILNQLIDYLHRVGRFGSQRCWIDADKMSVARFWQVHGEDPLKKLMIRLHSQPASASATETNWSEWDCVQGKKRTRLNPVRANKLVYLYHNRRLARKLEDWHYEASTTVPTRDLFDKLAENCDFEEQAED